ncbi:MAG TPA: hypothetical protein EYP21_00655 [Syntrophaceae bacterium]|nr:hypothetical protein [Syntrophaceae bacterium]
MPGIKIAIKDSEGRVLPQGHLFGLAVAVMCDCGSPVLITHSRGVPGLNPSTCLFCGKRSYEWVGYDAPNPNDEFIVKIEK